MAGGVAVLKQSRSLSTGLFCHTFLARANCKFTYTHNSQDIGL